MALSDRTHGRWPWLAAAAAGPATALAWRQRERLRSDGSWVEWLPLVALFWHQTEEWVWPGGFMPFANRTMIGSGEDEFPLDRRVGLIVNAGLGWGVGLLAGWRRDPGVSSLQLALLAGNVALHGSTGIRRRRWNPGLITAAGLFAPLVAAGYPALLRRAPRRPVAAGLLGGVLGSVGLMAAMRARLRAATVLTDARTSPRAWRAA